MISYYRRSLLDLFARAHRLSEHPVQLRSECLEIQEMLISRTRYIERQIRARRVENRELSRWLAIEGRIRRDRMASREVKHRRTDNNRVIEQYQELLWILKSIGDALAFTYMDKWEIKPMAAKEAPGFLTRKKGLRLELRVLRMAFEFGHVAILNDLTNSLRYGDLMCIFRGRYGQWKILEVKSGRQTSGRVHRQKEKADKLVNYLAADEVTGLYPSQGQLPMRRVSLQSDEVHYRHELNDLIERAYEQGFCFQQMESGLYYLVTTKQEPLMWRQVLDAIGRRPSFCFILNQLIPPTCGYYPLTLTIRNPIALFDFFNGALGIYVFVDCAAISKKLESLGWTVILQPNEEFALKMTRESPLYPASPDSLQISSHLFGRIGLELLSLDWALATYPSLWPAVEKFATE